MRAVRFGAIIAAIGTIIATYLLAIRYAGIPALCGPALGPFGGCAKVESSVYSSIGPIPVALVGVVGSLVLLAASVHYLRTRSTVSLNIWVLAAVVGAAIELVLIAIQAFAIGAWCGWCLLYGLTVILSAVAAIIAARQAERGSAAH
ncbi:MAG: vitamin K epoxide reductase family protein [bacterium]